MKTTLLALSIFLMLIFTGCISSLPLYEPESSFEYKGKYAAYFESNENEIYTWYHFVITRNEKGKYIKRIFYPEMSVMTSQMTYNDPSGLIANGPAKNWWDNGKLKSYGKYKQNKKEGKWHYYNPNGNLSESGEYVYSKREGKWVIYDGLGRIAEEVYYKKNLRNGEFIQYDTLGNLKNEGVYENNIIVKQTRTDTPERIEPYLVSCNAIADLRTKLSCSQERLLEYLRKNLKYPKRAIRNKVQGTAFTTFYVDKDGSITDIEVHTGLSDEIKEECIRLIENIPQLVAGRINGENEKMQMLLPLKFTAPISYYDY